MRRKKGRTLFFVKAVRPFFILSLIFFSFLSVSSAFQIPPKADGYVTDRAGLLTSSQKAELEEKLRAFEEKTSNQVVVATFPSLEGGSLEDFSMHLAEAWKAGQKGKDNGVIFLIFKNDRKIRIEVGYGLEGVFPDAMAGQIISQVVAPYFRKGDYEGGITAGVAAILKATQGEFKGGPRKKQNKSLARIVMLLFLLVFFQTALRRRAYDLNGRGGRYGGFYGGFPVGGGFSRGGFGGGFSGGGGGFGGGGASGGW